MVVGFACSGDDGTPSPTATTITAVSPTSEPTIPGYPLSTRTGNADVDAVLDVLENRDGAALRAIMRVQRVPCTTAAGLGGPPKCPDGVADGTPFDAFPVLGGEGRMVIDGQIDSVALTFSDLDWSNLYAVVKPISLDDDLYFTGDYAILLASGLDGTHVVYVEDGQVVMLEVDSGIPPESIGTGDYLLPPVP